MYPVNQRRELPKRRRRFVTWCLFAVFSVELRPADLPGTSIRSSIAHGTVKRKTAAFGRGWRLKTSFAQANFGWMNIHTYTHRHAQHRVSVVMQPLRLSVYCCILVNSFLIACRELMKPASLPIIWGRTPDPRPM